LANADTTPLTGRNVLIADAFVTAGVLSAFAKRRRPPYVVAHSGQLIAKFVKKSPAAKDARGFQVYKEENAPRKAQAQSWAQNL
jgi:hypothetical protein